MSIGCFLLVVVSGAFWILCFWFTDSVCGGVLEEVGWVCVWVLTLLCGFWAVFWCDYFVSALAVSILCCFRCCLCVLCCCLVVVFRVSKGVLYVFSLNFVRLCCWCLSDCFFAAVCVCYCAMYSFAAVCVCYCAMYSFQLVLFINNVLLIKKKDS